MGARPNPSSRPVAPGWLCLLLIGAGLFGRPSAAAADLPFDRHPDTDSLTAQAIAYDLRYGATPPVRSSPDQWIARDKATHVAVSTLVTLSTQYVLVTKADWSERKALPVSVTSSAVLGLAKEAYDASAPHETASAKDLAANAVGIAVGVGIVLL